MGGVFGFLDSKHETSASVAFGVMAPTMCHKDWYVVDRFVDPGGQVALGRVGIGIFNPEQQPILNEDGSLLILMEGELYDYDQRVGDLTEKGHAFRVGNDPEFMLHLFEEEGDSCIDELQGSFVMAIWDSVDEVLTIANDRYGLRPLFYTHYDGKFVFAPEMKAILKAPDCRRVLNKTAVAEFFRFQQVLGTKTFFEGVQLLPPASILRYDLRNDQLSITPYWDFDQIEPRDDISFEEAAAETTRLLEKAVNRLTRGNHTYGVYLTGGLDSRTLLGLLARDVSPIHSVTYGVPGCGDQVSARKIARRVGSKHHYHPLVNGDWVADCASLHLELTDCAASWMHSHGISTLDASRDVIDVNISGFAGGAVLGELLTTRELSGAMDGRAQALHLFRLFADIKGTGLLENEEKFLFCPSFALEAEGLAFDSFMTEVQGFHKYDPERRPLYFSLLNRDIRMLLHIPVIGRSHFEQRFAFWDYELLDFACSLPLRHRLGRKLQRAIINRALPELALISWQPCNILPSDNRLAQKGYSLKKGLVTLANKQIRDFLPQAIPVFSTPIAENCDYAGWLRRDIKDWAEAIAFDAITSERGIVNPGYFRSLFDRHMSGLEDCTPIIAAVTSLELFLRKNLD